MAFLLLKPFFFSFEQSGGVNVCAVISDNDLHPFMLLFLLFLGTLSSSYTGLLHTRRVSANTLMCKLSVYKANMHTSASLGLSEFM